MRTLVTSLAALPLLLPASRPAVTLHLEPVADATLIEEPAGALANGAGTAFFAGRTGQPVNGTRRALLRFDVDAALPRHARIEEARLVLQASSTNGGPHVASLHRVLATWSEGPSRSSGGQGAPSQRGDVTWVHTEYDRDAWVHAGGHFVASPSATGLVAGPGATTWSAARLAADVRLWLRAPSQNHGWLLAGDESEASTVTRFHSREHADPSLRPFLVVTYR